MQFEKCSMTEDVLTTTDDKTYVDAPQFTEQQIEEFCKLNETLPTPKLFDSNTVIQAIQIIRQLQAKTCQA